MLASVVLSAFVASAIATPFSSEASSPGEKISSGCGTDGPTSCSSSSSILQRAASKNDTCCTESPGGLLLQTQFWDTDPATGPDDSWTIHGLWGDNCDGTYEENCDSSRDYKDIGSLLDDQGASSTHDYMKKYWVNDPDDGSDEEFWEHEWATHGTCYSTLKPSCLPSGSEKGAEAVAFFQTVVKLFKTLPTYDWLEKGGITPGSKTYDVDDVLSALKDAAGVTPQLGCQSGALNSISWYFHLKGSVIDGKFIAIDAPEKGSCSGSVKYPTKSGSSSSGAKNRKRRSSVGPSTDAL